jgi:hypothetical protein
VTVDLRGAAYAASRINSPLKGSTKQFGWLQAPATKKSFLSRISASPATIRIDNFLRLARKLNASLSGWRFVAAQNQETIMVS